MEINKESRWYREYNSKILKGIYNALYVLERKISVRSVDRYQEYLIDNVGQNDPTSKRIMYGMALSEFLFDQRYYKRGIQALLVEILYEIFLWFVLPWTNHKKIS